MKKSKEPLSPVREIKREMESRIDYLCSIGTISEAEAERAKKVLIRQEISEFPIEFESREQLQEALKSRIMHHRFITPMVLLSQLRNRTIDQVALTLTILEEFDDGAIQRALYSLEAKGLE